MKDPVTREQVICDLRRVTEDLCREIEHELSVGLATTKHMEEAKRVAPVIRSWLKHLRAWQPERDLDPKIN